MNFREEYSKMIGCCQTTSVAKGSGDLSPRDTSVQFRGTGDGFASATAGKLSELLQMLSDVDSPEVADVYDVSELPKDEQSTALQQMANSLRNTQHIERQNSVAAIPIIVFGIDMVDAGYNLDFLISGNFLRKLGRSRAKDELGISTESTMMDIMNQETSGGSLTRLIAITNHGL